ncbi:MAG TPA: hypothetical protein VFX24_00725, partial [Ktedonobacterales bacterium]|nr:hypothetical protein [Ktedonobacterales bacterium]
MDYRKARIVTGDGDEQNKPDDGNGWDGFDWESLSDGTTRGDQSDPDGASDEDEAASAGEWVSQGGVLHWEEPEGTPDDIASDLRREAQSPWASETLTLPLGAPDALRVRGVRAWLARQRMLENEAMGMLLLERRQQSAHEDDDTAQRRTQAAGETHPLDIALAEHQAALAEYESLLAALDEVGMHNGPGRVLVEYHFSLGDRIATLATAPEAPDDFAETQLFTTIERTQTPAPVTPLSRAEWDGRAGAVLQARRRVERMTAP